MTDTFTWTPALDPTGDVKLRVRTAQYGDGYSQSVVDGINAKVQTWSLTFNSLDARIALIAAFLDAHIGISFYWTPPAGVQGYYQCNGYQKTPHGSGTSSLMGQFIQVFRP